MKNPFLKVNAKNATLDIRNWELLAINHKVVTRSSGRSVSHGLLLGL